jgi:hypothetical protein
MRPLLTGFTMVFGVIGMGDLALGPVYVPGKIRDGFYIRPHFVSAPKQGRADEPEDESPLLVPAPPPRNPLGEES